MLTNNIPSIENTTSKVYINPNFNRNFNNNAPNAGMHVNPRFSHLLSNAQPKSQNKPKIHINPNFVKSNKKSDDLAFRTNVNNITSIHHQNTVHNTNFLYHNEKPETEMKALEPTVPIARSRYSLVKHTTNILKVDIVEKSRNTYQVNKYKSIPLKDYKKNLEYTKKIKGTFPSHTQPNNAISIDNKYLAPSTSNTNQFKLVNHKNIGPVVRLDKIKIKALIDTKKVQLRQIRLKRSKGELKKNNIPCPMFKKFGKCLRKIRGKCELLHDKKHVSVCRKFIKGLCHDKECLLSHDLTTQKMPTCYFYLQGTCTKPDCPYLHVKLSEKVKICPDFLKGYCEKGSKCLQRHINIQSGKTAKGTMTKSPLPSKKKYTRIKDNSLDHKNAAAVKQNIEHSTVTVVNSLDYRYYQEQKDMNTGDSCEVIKPMRCKLGTLPSFIQL